MMTKQSQKYDREFKKKAVELSIAHVNAREVAEELDIRPELLYRRREYDMFEANSFPGHGKPKMTDLERENSRLQKELRQVKMERDILKKAVSIFSRTDGKSTKKSNNIIIKTLRFPLLEKSPSGKVKFKVQ